MVKWLSRYVDGWGCSITWNVLCAGGGGGVCGASAAADLHKDLKNGGCGGRRCWGEAGVAVADSIGCCANDGICGVDNIVVVQKQFPVRVLLAPFEVCSVIEMVSSSSDYYEMQASGV